MAGGTTTFEAACSGLPMVLLAIADNQIQGAQAWANTGSAVFLGMLKETSAEKLVEKVSRLLDSESTRKEMADKARKCVDGKGGDRVAARIMNKIEKTAEKSVHSTHPLDAQLLETRRLRLRPMTEADGEIVVSWRNSDHVASMSRTPQREALTVEKHLQWFRHTRADRIDYIIEEKIPRSDKHPSKETPSEKNTFRPIGSLSFTRRKVPGQLLKNCAELKKCAELGKYIGEKTALGKGYGYEATACWLEYGFAVLELDCVIAATLLQNKANIRINKKLGFSEAGPRREAFLFEVHPSEPRAEKQSAPNGFSREWLFMILKRADWIKKQCS